MKKIALGAATLAALVMTSAPAQATRPIVGYEYPDLCWNISGVQTILMFHGPGTLFEFDYSTPRPGDCVTVSRVKR